MRSSGTSSANVCLKNVSPKAAGVRVPDAAQEVTFDVRGPARLLGIGNGDPSNTEAPRGHVHQAYEGRGLAILQSTTTPGAVTVTATAPGLTPATVVLHSEMAGR